MVLQNAQSTTGFRDEKGQETNDSEINLLSEERGKEQVATQTDVDAIMTVGSKHASGEVEIERGSNKNFVYKVSDRPPLQWAILFAFQQAMVSIYAPLTTTVVVSEAACARDDDALKLQILCTTMFMSGLATMTMCLFGVRLPIFQGPMSTYLLPLIAMQSLEEFKCPSTLQAVDPTANSTILMADIGNGTYIPNREVSLARIQQMSGSLVATGVFHFSIGASGFVGILTKYIGPVTIVPTITLLGLQMYTVIVRFSEADWGVAIFTSAVALTLSLYLRKRKTPVLMWSRQKGFYIFWYPVHQVLSILISLSMGWLLSAILTSASYYSDDPESKDFMARTDASGPLISNTNWLKFPYPGQFGGFSFDTAVFMSFMVATLSSVLDSIGDYAACARIANTSPPPPFAFNRGLAVEGFMSALSGFMGCCHGTVSYGGNMGAMSVTRVTSLRVFQIVGVLYMAMGILGKLGAVLISVPYPVLGGLYIIIMGMFIGMILSCLQTLDLNSTRNMAIIGISFVLGFCLPYWVSKSPEGINTGSQGADSVFRLLLSNPGFVAGVVSSVLDNTVPGTLRERGLSVQMEDLEGADNKGPSKKYDVGPEIYRLPFIPDSFRRSRFARLVPIFDGPST